MTQAVPYRRPRGTTRPTYGLRNPETQTPNTSANQMDDRDVASGMLGCHKASATLKMVASLECADPNLRRMVQQGAINCAEEAYEVWQYMNQKGFYQVPTMKQQTTNTTLGAYGTTGGTNFGRGTAGAANFGRSPAGGTNFGRGTTWGNTRIAGEAEQIPTS